MSSDSVTNVTLAADYASSTLPYLDSTAYAKSAAVYAVDSVAHTDLNTKEIIFLVIQIDKLHTPDYLDIEKIQSNLEVVKPYVLPAVELDV